MSVSLWRIGTDTPDYTAEELTGEGARQTGGRWNRKDVALTYASESIALACLETLVHLGKTPLPFNRYLVRIEVPDKVFAARSVFETLLPAARRVGWDAVPAGRVSIACGSDWVRKDAAAILDVPSVIIPEERNYLLSPAHPDAGSITATKVRRFDYDSRLR